MTGADVDIVGAIVVGDIVVGKNVGCIVGCIVGTVVGESVSAVPYIHNVSIQNLSTIYTHYKHIE